MTTVIAISARLAVEAIVGLLRQLLPAWLIGAPTPESHGSSRWAKTRERRLLGRAARAERMHGDGIVRSEERRGGKEC